MRYTVLAKRAKLATSIAERGPMTETPGGDKVITVNDHHQFMVTDNNVKQRLIDTKVYSMNLPTNIPESR